MAVWVFARPQTISARTPLSPFEHRDRIATATTKHERPVYVYAHHGHRNPRRLRLLHLAAFEGSMDTVLLLLSAGASVNAQDLDGWTPLMYAARNETEGETLVCTLVAAGAELDKKNNRGRTGERGGASTVFIPA